MLKLKYLFENFDLARKCMELYEYDKKSVDEMLRYFRISSNAIYPFRSEENKVCFLRISPAEEKAFEDVTSEIQLIEWLIEKDFLAMRPVPMKDGKLATQIQTEWGIYNVSCFEKVPGKSLEDAEGTLDIVRGYGRTLGELHALTKEYPYWEERRDHKALLKDLEGRLKKYNAPDVIQKEFVAVCKELEQLTILPLNYGVIHYDFEPDNVFYEEKGERFSVIDFDDAIRCWYALDVVRALDALDDVVENIEMEEAECHFLKGYQSATGFSQEQRQSLPLMRRLVRLQEYATILHVTSEPVNEAPDWMKKLEGRLKRKLQVLEQAMVGEV